MTNENLKHIQEAHKLAMEKYGDYTEARNALALVAIAMEAVERDLSRGKNLSIEVPISQGELEDLMNNEEFKWRFPAQDGYVVEVYLHFDDEEEMDEDDDSDNCDIPY